MIYDEDENLFKYTSPEGIHIEINQRDEVFVFDRYVTLLPKGIDREKYMQNLVRTFTSAYKVLEEPYLPSYASRLMNVARDVAGLSPHPRTQAGCVIADITDRRKLHVLGHGYNGFPDALVTPENYEDLRMTSRKKVPHYTIHAEIRALLSMQERAEKMAAAIYPIPPCIECAKALVQAKIDTVIFPTFSVGDFDRWIESIAKGLIVFTMAGVDILRVYDNMGEEQDV